MARQFYGVGEAKGFAKKDLYQAVIDYVNGDLEDEQKIALMVAACEYELDGIAKAKEKNSSKPKTPTLEKQIALDIIKALVPMLGDEPQTTEELIKLATDKGLKTSKGTNFSNPWVNTVFKALMEEGRITKVSKVVSVTKTKDGQSLTSQEPKIAYTRNPK